MTKLTSEDVFRVVGHGRLDDQTLTELITMEATSDDLIEAYERTIRGGTIGAETLRPMSPVVSQLFNILQAADERDAASEED